MSKHDAEYDHGVGDYEGTCRTCWRVRNMGVGWRPKGGTGITFCNRDNPDGSTCHGKLLIALTKEAERRVAISRKQKKIIPKGVAK